MRFRTVILVSIWSVVAGALIIGYILVNYAMWDQVESQTARDLENHRSTIRALNTIQLEDLGKTTGLYAETPRLKAVMELGDSNTIIQLLTELQEGIQSDILAVTDANGETTLGILSGHIHAFEPESIITSVRPPARSAFNGIIAVDTSAYRLASAPIPVGGDVIGTLIVGFRIVEDQLYLLKDMIDSELLLLVGSHVRGSTFTGPERDEVTEWFQNAGEDHLKTMEHDHNNPPIDAAGELFKTTVMRLDGGNPPKESSAVRLAILKPIRRETEIALVPVLRSFLILSVVVLVITIGVGIVVSRSVTKPIGDLVKGTGEISRGNYDYQMEIPKGQELKFLAIQFGEMSNSLKEKVRQLGRQNAELEMTLKKLRETQEELIKSERLAAMGKLTGQLSHEINNPVHNILSSLQTALRKVPERDPARLLLEVAYEEVDRLARLTSQLLYVYRGSITVPGPRTMISVNDVVNSVVASSMESLRNIGIDVRLSLDETLPAIRGSSDELKQLFLNLIVNARDAMPQGGCLSITSARRNGFIEVAVADTGIGIPPENIHRVFDAFFTTKGKVSGTGLGLSVSYGIVRQHGGNISVRSEPGAGTTFIVSFPVQGIDPKQETV